MLSLHSLTTGKTHQGKPHQAEPGPCSGENFALKVLVLEDKSIMPSMPKDGTLPFPKAPFIHPVMHHSTHPTNSSDCATLPYLDRNARALRTPKRFRRSSSIASPVPTPLRPPSSLPNTLAKKTAPHSYAQPAQKLIETDEPYLSCRALARERYSSTTTIGSEAGHIHRIVAAFAQACASAETGESRYVLYVDGGFPRWR